MKLFVAVSLLGASAVASTSSLAGQAAGQKTALVTVLVESASPLKELTKSDFMVRENDKNYEVLAAQLSPEPLYISLLIDTSQPPPDVTPSATQDLRTAVETFVKGVLDSKPDSKIALTEVAGAAVTAVPFTDSREALDKVVRRLYPNQPTGAVMLEAIGEAAKALSDKPTPRRAIVVIDFASREDSAEGTLNSVAQAVQKSGATVWTVSVRGRGASSPNRDRVLNLVTQGSGGLRQTAVESSGLESMLNKVAHSLLSQYAVTFARDSSGPVKGIRMETARGAKVLLSPWMR
jgi:hypothetical protein